MMSANGKFRRALSGSLSGLGAGKLASQAPGGSCRGARKTARSSGTPQGGSRSRGCPGVQAHLRHVRAGPSRSPCSRVGHSPAAVRLGSDSKRLEDRRRRIRRLRAPSPSLPPPRIARTCPMRTMVIEGPPSPARLAEPAGPESVIRATRESTANAGSRIGRPSPSSPGRRSEGTGAIAEAHPE